LVREFAGEDAVQGDTVYMDPVDEVEAFSQWLIHDIPLPSEKQSVIESFVQEESSNLPADELALLKLQLGVATRNDKRPDPQSSYFWAHNK
ncbi:MAG: hypothetical protein KKA54_12165, partial [Proteobacteria bacterium]|nr:hypothetical protein [Pseudomonadota bacterium]